MVKNSNENVRVIFGLAMRDREAGQVEANEPRNVSAKRAQELVDGGLATLVVDPPKSDD